MGVWVCIVEGEGDAKAVPLLLRRIVHGKFQKVGTQFAPIKLKGRGNIQTKFMNFLELALKKSNLEAIFIVVDSEGNCPKNLAQQLSQWVRQRNPHVPVAIVVAHQCYEAWLLAGHCLSSQSETIAPGTAKKLIGRKMGKPYKETIDQPSLTAQMVIWKAFRRCRSFRRFFHAVKQLIAAIDNRQIVVTP